MRLVVVTLLVAAFLSASVPHGLNPCKNILPDAEWASLQANAGISYTKGFIQARDKVVAAYNAAISKESGVILARSALQTIIPTTNRSGMTSASMQPNESNQSANASGNSGDESMSTPNSTVLSIKSCATNLVTLFTDNKNIAFLYSIQEYIRRCKMAHDLRLAFYKGSSYFDVPDTTSRAVKTQLLKERQIEHASSTTAVSNSKTDCSGGIANASVSHGTGHDIKLHDLPKFRRLSNTSSASYAKMTTHSESNNEVPESISNRALYTATNFPSAASSTGPAAQGDDASQAIQYGLARQSTRSTVRQSVSRASLIHRTPRVAQNGSRCGTLWSKRNTTLAKILKKKAMQQPYRTRINGDVSFGRSSNMSTYCTPRSAMTNQRKSVSRNNPPYTIREITVAQPSVPQTRRPYIRSRRPSQPLSATVNQIDDRTCNNGIFIDRVIPFAWRLEKHAEYTHAALQYGLDDIAIDLLVDLEACVLANDIRGAAGITDVVRNHPDVCVEERLQSVQTRFFMAEHIPTLLLLYQTVPSVKVHTKLALLTICPKRLAKDAFSKHFELEAIYNRIMVAIHSFNRKFEVQQHFNKITTANSKTINANTAEKENQHNGSNLSSSMILANDQRLPCELTWTDTTQLHCPKSTTSNLVPLGTRLFYTLLSDDRDGSIAY